MSSGATQASRLPEAFQGEMAKVDGATVDQHLVMSYRLGRRLRLAGSAPGHDGTWGSLLEHDESVLIARSQSLNLLDGAALFLDDFAAARPESLARRIRSLIRWLRRWARALEGVRRPWAVLMHERAIRVLEEYQEEPDLAVRADPESLENLRQTYFKLAKSLDHLADLAGSVREAALASQVHEPAASLLIAFCRLSERVQSRANGFADRLIDFYYRDVLRMQAKPPQADFAHILLQRDPTFPAPVVVPAGTAFVVPRSGSTPVTFRADADLTVTDARVEQLLTLRLQRDVLISPDSSLGFVTGAKVDHFDANVGRDDEARQISVALLGGDARGAMRQGDDARIGLAVSSPVLWLREGARRITLSLTFDFGPERVSMLLLALKKAARTWRRAAPGSRAREDAIATFSHALGRLFARWVLPDRGFRRDVILDVIRKRAEPLLATETFRVRHGVVDDGGDGVFDNERFSFADPLVLLLAMREGDYPEESRRSLIRDEVVESLFRVALSTADGWHDIYRPVMIEEPGETPLDRHTMTLVMELANEDPAIEACTPEVHGPEWPTAAPTVRLTVNKHARIFPLSLLEETVLHAVDIRVDVDGVRDVQAFNHLGPLDTSRPFMPFGPLPDTASYVVLGSPELASKYPTRLEVRPEWSGLPPRGFDIHYDAYDEDYGAAAYRVAPTILRDGVWTSAGPPLRLFREGAPPQGLPIALDPGELRSRWRPATGAFAAAPTTRNGLIRLQLTSPEGGFGHKAYPMVLTEVVSANAKDKKRRPLPNPPYTPQLERLTLAYSASTRMELKSHGALRAGADEHILHMHPFGVEEIHPGGFDWVYGMVPELGQDGNLYIALSGSPPQGQLTLFFDLRRDAAVDVLARREPRPKPRWSYLTEDRGWRRLNERRVLADTTSGFLTSGIVSLDLPGGLTRDSKIMPAGRYWLRLSCDAPSGCFAGLKAVRAQALRATRVLDEPPVTALPAGSIGMNSAALPGVIAVEQPEPSLSLRPAETSDQFRARVGERLRHKHRASTPWDFERLALERFDYVSVVRCLANTRDDAVERSPGHILVVATPVVPRNDPRYSCRPMRLDPLQLREMETYLSGLASPGMTLKVRNASYDLVQVRGRVLLDSNADEGEVLRRVNAAVVSFLSPWHDGGRFVQFDWELRAEEIEACIRAVRGVRHVKGVSLMQVWEHGGHLVPNGFFLQDTAVAPNSPVRLRYRQRWSLALPTEEHFIEISEDVTQDARATGIAGRARGERSPGIEIGRSFVVGRRT